MSCRVEATSSVNIGSAELGAPLCLSHTQLFMAKFSQSDVGSPAQSGHPRFVALYVLMTLVLIALVAILIVLLLDRKGAPSDVAAQPSAYAWQASCDARCAELIGAKTMTEIDLASCGELATLKSLVQAMGQFNQVDQDETYWVAEYKLKAVTDRMAFARCP